MFKNNNQLQGLMGLHTNHIEQTLNWGIYIKDILQLFSQYTDDLISLQYINTNIGYHNNVGGVIQLHSLMQQKHIIVQLNHKIAESITYIFDKLCIDPKISHTYFIDNNTVKIIITNQEQKIITQLFKQINCNII